MTAQGTTRRRTAPRNFYRAALDAAEREDLDGALAAEGLDDEVALLRLLVRRELEAEPRDLKLVLQGLTLLVRAVAVRYRLSPADEEALRSRVAATVDGIVDSLRQAAEAPLGGELSAGAQATRPMDGDVPPVGFEEMGAVDEA